MFETFEVIASSCREVDVTPLRYHEGLLEVLLVWYGVFDQHHVQSGLSRLFLEQLPVVSSHITSARSPVAPTQTVLY